MSQKPATPALDQVMHWIETQDDLAWDFKIPADIYTQAVKEGLASQFVFAVRYTPADQNPSGEDEPHVYTVIYPKGMDHLWQGSDFLQPLLPEGNPAHECMETEWSFDGVDNKDPGAIAKFMISRGIALDEAFQKEREPEAYAMIKQALAVKPAQTPKTQGPKP